MKTRIIIHTEQITIQGEIRHFVLHLPPDCKFVFGIKITATPSEGKPKLHHIQAGTLRLSREGVMLYQSQVCYGAQEPNFSNVRPPSVIERTGNTYQEGGKQGFDPVFFLGETAAINALYASNNSLTAAYTLRIYLLYKTLRP